MDELRILLSGYSLEPWNRFTAGLVAAMAVARLLDFLSTWVVRRGWSWRPTPSWVGCAGGGRR